MGAGAAGATAAPPVDPDAYRAAKEAATRTFFDSEETVEARVKAAEGLGYPDRQTMKRLLILGRNPEEPDAIRWEALRRYPWTPVLVSTVLEILEDPENGSEQLNADLLHDLSRRTVTIKDSQLRQSMQAAFRKRLDDSRDTVRLNAFYALISSQDHVAIAKLVDGMQEGSPPVPAANAIRLLDMAGARRHFNTLRPYLNDDDIAVKAEAARVLAADADSRPVIQDLITNGRTPEAIRVEALKGMTRFDEKLASYAIPILRESDEPDSVRRAAMDAMVGQINYGRLEDSVEVEFAAAVDDLANDPTDSVGPKTRRQAAVLLRNLRKASPAIREFLETNN